jgi:hypothetical protein
MSTILTAGGTRSKPPGHHLIRHQYKRLGEGGTISVERLEVYPRLKDRGDHIVSRFTISPDGSSEWMYAEFYTREAAEGTYAALEAQSYEVMKFSLEKLFEEAVGFVRIEKCEQDEVPWFYQLLDL